MKKKQQKHIKIITNNKIKTHKTYKMPLELSQTRATLEDSTLKPPLPTQTTSNYPLKQISLRKLIISKNLLYISQPKSQTLHHKWHPLQTEPARSHSRGTLAGGRQRPQGGQPGVVRLLPCGESLRGDGGYGISLVNIIQI